MTESSCVDRNARQGMDISERLPKLSIHAKLKVVRIFPEGVTLAHSFRIYPEKRVAIFKFWDEVSTASAKQAFVQYTSHEDFDPSYVMLTDAREVSRIDATFLGILHGVEGLRDVLAKFDRGTISVVLVKDSTQFGYVRMLEQVLDFLSPIRIRIAFQDDDLRALSQRPDLSIAQLAAG